MRLNSLDQTIYERLVMQRGRDALHAIFMARAGMLVTSSALVKEKRLLSRPQTNHNHGRFERTIPATGSGIHTNSSWEKRRATTSCHRPDASVWRFARSLRAIGVLQ
jgi:hypothetical protein